MPIGTISNSEIGSSVRSKLNQALAILDGTVPDALNFAFGSTSGTKFGTATTQKLGFFNATPIVQPANTTDLRTVLINLGFLASGGASPLDLNGGALTVGSVAVADGGDVALGTTTGTKFGTSASQKIGFYNTTPIVQAVVPTGSSTDTVITALQNLGLIRQS